MNVALLAAALALAPLGAAAAQASIAVAANFAPAAAELAERFSRASGHRLALSAGSTGKLYAQARNGAPFDALLAADADTPLRVEREGFAVPGSRFTYALGRLVLWSAQKGLVDDGAEVLRQARFRRLAIANPKLAPYGAAAVQTLQRLGVWMLLQDRLVQGENIAQAFQFVASGSAELGFVARSQLRGREQTGSHWEVPGALHAPLRQDAALLARGERNAAARDFLGYLKSAGARETIRAYGYDLP